MFFNVFLLAIWCLTFVSPVGDYKKYLLSLSDDRITAPDIPARIALPSDLFLPVLAFDPAPAPVPLPRFSPLVIPVYHAGNGKDNGPVRFNREKRLISIHRWMNVVISALADSVARPRPTKTTHPLTESYTPAFPASPTSSERSIVKYPVQSPTCVGFDLGGIWYAYRLAFGWVAVTILLTILISIRFLGRRSSYDLKTHSSDPSPPVASPNKFESIIDIYCELGFPPVIETDASSNSSADPAESITYEADIEGSTDTDGDTSMGETSLQSAASSSSIGTSFVGLYRSRSTFMTPSSSNMPIGPSASNILASYSAAGPSTTVSQNSLYELIGQMVD